MNNQEMDFNAEYQKLLMKTPANFTVSEGWKSLVYNALKYTSPINMGINNDELRGLVERLRNNQQLSMYDFACLNTNLEKRTPIELNLTLNAYLDMMDEIGEYAKEWNALTQPMRDTILQKLAAPKMKVLHD